MNGKDYMDEEDSPSTGATEALYAVPSGTWTCTTAFAVGPSIPRHSIQDRLVQDRPAKSFGHFGRIFFVSYMRQFTCLAAPRLKSNDPHWVFHLCSSIRPWDPQCILITWQGLKGACGSCGRSSEGQGAWSSRNAWIAKSSV